MKILDSF